MDALNSLLRRASIEDHDEALRLAAAALKSAQDKSGNEALRAAHTRVVALLKLDRFDDALRAVADGGAALADRCVLERAYALYKTGALDEAEAVLRSGPADGGRRGLQHVAAQVAYRSEKFETAAQLYRELAADRERGHYGEENDLRINALAVNAQLEWQGNGRAVPAAQKQPGREDMEAFETAYNAACGCAARGDFAKAEFLLKRSRALCEALEDLGEDEKKAELVPITVQQAYVCTKLGKRDEALRLSDSISLKEIPDASTRAVAVANSMVLKAQSNPYVAQRLASSLPSHIPASDRLFGYQASALSRNEMALKLQTQKFPGVKRAAAMALDHETVPAISPDKTRLGVARAAATSELHTGKEALRRILPLLDAHPDDVGLLLTIIQLYVQTSNPGPAVSLLEAFFKRLEAATTPDHADVRFAPGLVAVAVALYRLQGRGAAIRAELAKASAHWQSKEASAAPAAAESLLREAGVELLRSPNPADVAAAGHAFERLVEAHPDDRLATAGLVASFATSDLAKVQPYLDTLTPVEKLAAGVDVESLLAAGVASLPRAPPLAGKKRALDDGAAEGPAGRGGKQAQQQAAPKRRRRLPKNYDESRTPDPERWLPLRDRSSYRPKGKKGKRRAAEATQGGIVRDDQETLELAGGAGSVRVERAPPSGGGGAAAKKKKKGKK